MAPSSTQIQQPGSEVLTKRAHYVEVLAELAAALVMWRRAEPCKAVTISGRSAAILAAKG